MPNKESEKNKKLENVTIVGDFKIDPNVEMKNVTISTGYIKPGSIYGSNIHVPNATNSTIVGSNIIVGDAREVYMGQISKLAMESGNIKIVEMFFELQNENKKEKPDKQVMEKILDSLKNLASLNGAVSLIEKVKEFSHYFL